MKNQISSALVRFNDWRPLDFSEFAVFWIFNYAESRKAPSSLHRDKGMLRNYLIPAFGKCALEQVNSLNIEIWFSSLKENCGISEKSCNNILGLLQKMFNDAFRWGFVASNPVALVRKFRLGERDFRFWSIDEIRQFLGYWQNHTQQPRILIPVTLSLYTGMRRGELIALKWESINLESKLITVKRAYCRTAKKILEMTKSKKIRHIPICAMLNCYLISIKSETFSSGYVCPPIHPDCFHKEFKKLARKADVPVIRFHDLRHTFASNFLMGGGNIYDLQKILGHSTIQVTERYAHLSPGHLQGKTEVLGF